MSTQDSIMDFRMDKVSWGMLAFMVAVMMFFLLSQVDNAGFGGYIQALLYGVLATLALVAVMSIPVLIYCYFVKVIPDIDYSIRAAFVFTIIGIISELIF